jgi:uncharacterized protein
MTLFVLIFLSLYSALHLYVFLKAKAAFKFGRRFGLLLAFFFIVMITSPITVRLCENSGLDLFAIIMAYAGSLWLGCIFYFLWPSLFIDLYRAIIFIAQKLLKSDLKTLTLSARAAFIIPVAISLAISSYAFYEALNVQTEHVTIETEKLPPGVDRIRIAQISDVHIGLIIRSQRLDNILQKVKEAKPDILVSTGDLLDGQLDGVSEFAALFHSINPPLGKFAVIGNHEYISGIDRALQFTESTGFRILRQSGLTIDNAITLVGVDDPAIKRHTGKKLAPEKNLLLQFPRDRFTVLLKHRPDVNPSSVGLFDLQLSGHTHGGQIFPFSIATYFYYGKHHTGMLKVNNALRYVNRGAGTAGPPLRFLAPPEVTVIDIVRKTAASS